jgi:hypothetical protein
MHHFRSVARDNLGRRSHISLCCYERAGVKIRDASAVIWSRGGAENDQKNISAAVWALHADYG